MAEENGAITVARILITLLCLTGLVYGGVSLWYDRVQERMAEILPVSQSDQVPQRDSTIEQPSGEAEQSGPVDHQIIVTRNIFQAVVDIAGEKQPVEAESLEETSLQLVLLGTVVGDEENARAIIVDEKEKKQELYRIGDSIQNAKIEKIVRGKVILDVNGQTEALTIKERKSNGRAAPEVSDQQRALQRTVPQRRVPVVRPTRRISFREGLQASPDLPEVVEEPEEPLENEDDEEYLEETEDLESEESAEEVDQAPEAVDEDYIFGDQ